MSPDLRTLLGSEALGDATARLVQAVEPLRIVTGWATVELDRAEAEVAALLGLATGVTLTEAAPDLVLGARCRILRSADTEIVLLEPSTEGRLAAGLARHGEGSLVAYLLVTAAAPERARRARFQLSNEGAGPFGRERLVRSVPRWGPFLVLAGLD